MDTDGVADVRLRPARLPDDVALALPWYRDAEVLLYSEGGDEPYDAEAVMRMYEHLSSRGELYIIEVKTPEGWLAIGDAALCDDALPIAIGDAAYRSRGIGTQVLRMLIERARNLGWATLRVKGVYTYNARARRLFVGAGFRLSGERTDEAGQAMWTFERTL